MITRDRIKYTLDQVRNFDYHLSKIIDDNKEVLRELNESQILAGKNSDGEYFSPTYTNDPYFKSPEKGANYQRFKTSLLADHNARAKYPIFGMKPEDVPNLIVTGPFLDGLFIETGRNEFNISSSYIDADRINSKYNNKVFGISPTAMRYFRENYILPQLRTVFGL